jgi:hypothetical protein
MATKATPKKAASKPPSKRLKTDKAQFERFVEAAKKIGVDEDPEALDRAFEKIAPQRKPSP